ncbi:MAG: winged helix-turn-helix domain-containing protein, partial [Chromatiaceae bacterium]
MGQALLLDPDSVRTYFKRYQPGGLAELLRLSFIGSEALLADAEWCELDAHRHLQRHLTVASVVHWVAERFGVRYSQSGMTALRHRLRYVDKKAKLIPGKADSTRQEACVDEYEKLKE